MCIANYLGRINMVFGAALRKTDPGSELPLSFGKFDDSAAIAVREMGISPAAAGALAENELDAVLVIHEHVDVVVMTDENSHHVLMLKHREIQAGVDLGTAYALIMVADYPGPPVVVGVGELGERDVEERIGRDRHSSVFPGGLLADSLIPANLFCSDPS